MNGVTPATPSADSFLTVGQAVKLSLTLDNEKRMYGSTMLGWKEHAWLVCEWPAQLGHTISIPKGTLCTISYLRDGTLVGYRTEVRDSIASPVPLLFLAFPQVVEEMQLRRHVRVSACEPALLMRADTNRGGASPVPSQVCAGGMVRDLSVGGCSLAVAQKPAWVKPGAGVRLEFELPGLGHVTNLTGIVKNVDVHENSHLLGLEFQFGGTEYIEYRGWGGSVRLAIEQWTVQRNADPHVALP